jgi:hypothetical protein
MGFLAVLGTVGAVADAIVKVKKAKDEVITQRSVVLILENYTDRVFRVDWDDHDHGDFSVNPTGEIPARTADVFGSKSKGGSFGTGTKGSVTYKEANRNLYVQIRWGNPWAGGNSCTIWAFKYIEAPEEFRDFMRWIPVTSNEVRAWHSCGGGNYDAQMRYEIRPPG